MNEQSAKQQKQLHPLMRVLLYVTVTLMAASMWYNNLTDSDCERQPQVLSQTGGQR